MSPNHNLSRQACFCSFICHNDPSISSRESMHIHKFGQTLKLKSYVVTVKTRSSSLNLFSVSKQYIYASLVQKYPHWFRRQSQEKAEFTAFLRMVPLK